MNKLLYQIIENLEESQKEELIDFLIQAISAIRFETEFNKFVHNTDTLPEESIIEREMMLEKLEEVIEKFGD